jgi:hypothetical protein
LPAIGASAFETQNNLKVGLERGIGKEKGLGLRKTVGL